MLTIHGSHSWSGGWEGLFDSIDWPATGKQGKDDQKKPDTLNPRDPARSCGFITSSWKGPGHCAASTIHREALVDEKRLLLIMPSGPIVIAAIHYPFITEASLAYRTLLIHWPEWTQNSFNSHILCSRSIQ